MDLGALLNPQGPPTEGDDTLQRLQQGWNGISSDPRALGALLSMSGALVQPPQFGQNTLGHLLGGLGAAGDSARTTEGLDLKQKEADSKGELRAAQAGAAEARSNSASARNDASATRLQIAQQSEEGKNARNQLGNVIRYQRLYQDYVKQIQKENANSTLLGQPAKPVLGFNDWSNSNPQLRTLLGVPAEPDSSGGADTGAPTGNEAIGASVDPLEGRTATGPGGKKMIRKNGQWLPL